MTETYTFNEVTFTIFGRPSLMDVGSGFFTGRALIVEYDGAMTVACIDEAVARNDNARSHYFERFAEGFREAVTMKKAALEGIE